MRESQSRQQCVWFALYDDDLQQEIFAGKIAHCIDQELPSEFVSFKLIDYEPFLLNSNAVCVRKNDAIDRLIENSMGSSTLVRLYLVKMSQLFDIVFMKNY